MYRKNFILIIEKRGRMTSGFAVEESGSYEVEKINQLHSN